MSDLLPPVVCAATGGELAAMPPYVLGSAPRFVSGVGIPATFAFFWQFRLAGDYVPPSLILNIGIAGAYPDTGLAIGDIVLADSDVYGDVGMELPPEDSRTESDFLPLARTEFGKDIYGTPLAAALPDFLPRQTVANEGFRVHTGRGCTVNTCTGTGAVGRRRARQTGAVFETMEGAAVLQTGQMLGVPVCQIRAISNFAADRDMRPENIRRALANLHRYLNRIEL